MDNIVTQSGSSWQPWEDQIIRDFYPDLTTKPEMLEKLPHRGKTAIQKRANILKVRANIVWKDWEVELLKENYASPETRPELYEKLKHRSEATIINKASSLGIKAIPANKFWESWEDELIRNNYPDISVTQPMLDLLPHRTLTSIQSRANTLGLKLQNVGGRRRNLELNTYFFSKPNPLNSYWAGFAAADGSVGRGRSLTFNLSIKDKNHLESLVDALNYGGEIKEFESPGYTKSMMCKLHIESKNIVTDLHTNFGVGERKTFSLQFPSNLSEENQKAFIAGYIDGDGSIGLTSRYGGKQLDLVFQVIGTEEILINIKRLVDTYPASMKRIKTLASVYEDKRHPGVFCYRVGGTRFLPFALDMIDLGEKYNLPLMQRKWDKVGQYIKLKQV